MNLIDAARQALEALEEFNEVSKGVDAVCLPGEIDMAMDALRQAIGQAEQQEPVAEVMATVTKAMQDDPGYAWSWHCNIAMAFVDAGGDHYTANQGAARFMKLLANVEPAHELPSVPPQRKPLTDKEIMQIKPNNASFFSFRAGIRYMERAHGITGDNT